VEIQIEPWIGPDANMKCVAAVGDDHKKFIVRSKQAQASESIIFPYTYMSPGTAGTGGAGSKLGFPGLRLCQGTTIFLPGAVQDSRGGLHEWADGWID